MQELRECTAQETQNKYGLAVFGNEVEQIEIKQSQKERQNQKEHQWTKWDRKERQEK